LGSLASGGAAAVAVVDRRVVRACVATGRDGMERARPPTSSGLGGRVDPFRLAPACPRQRGFGSEAAASS